MVIRRITVIMGVSALVAFQARGQDLLTPPVPSVQIAQQSHQYLNQALLQRSLAELRRLSADWNRTSSSDRVWLDRAEIDRRRENRLGALRRLTDFTDRRSDAPLAPMAMLERGLMALEDGDHATGAELCGMAATMAQRSKVLRGDSVYGSIAQLASFWEATSRAHRGEFEKALDGYRRATTGDDDIAAQARYAIGQVYEQNGQDAEA